MKQESRLYGLEQLDQGLRWLYTAGYRREHAMLDIATYSGLHVLTLQRGALFWFTL